MVAPRGRPGSGRTARAGGAPSGAAAWIIGASGVGDGSPTWQTARHAGASARCVRKPLLPKKLREARRAAERPGVAGGRHPSVLSRSSADAS